MRTFEIELISLRNSHNLLARFDCLQDVALPFLLFQSLELFYFYLRVVKRQNGVMSVLFLKTCPLIIDEVFRVIGMKAYPLQNAPLRSFVSGPQVFLEVVVDVLLDICILEADGLLLLQGLD